MNELAKRKGAPSRMENEIIAEMGRMGMGTLKW